MGVKWFLLLACLVSVGNATNAANQLVECMDRLHKVSTSTTTVELTKLFNGCEDAMDYYSKSGIRKDSIWPIWSSLCDNLKNKAINEVEQHLQLYTEHLLNTFLDKKTSHVVIQGLKSLRYIYKTYNHGKVEIQLIQRTVGRFATTNLLFNPATTKATEWAATIGYYSNHVGIVADVAEYGLGLAGYESQGRVVGAVGNTVSGAMTGFSIAGPPGAAIGAGLGLLMWWN